MLPAVHKSPRNLLLGIDVGSSGLKAVLLSPEVGIVATETILAGQRLIQMLGGVRSVLSLESY
jgi:activator of 2-hydroxyglutaryl-CoA dehydratase